MSLGMVVAASGSMTSAVAKSPPAGGGNVGEILIATLVSFAAVAVVAAVGVRHRRHQTLAPLVRQVEERTGLPAWTVLPVGIVGREPPRSRCGATTGTSPGTSTAVATPARSPTPRTGSSSSASTASPSAACWRSSSATAAAPSAVRLTERWSVPVGRPAPVGLRRGRAGRLPARRHLAPAVRAGRDGLGADPPPADRRSVAVHACLLGARRGGPAGGRRGAHAAGPQHRQGRRRRVRRRAPDRDVDPAGGVRLRRAAVPGCLPPGAHRPRGRAWPSWPCGSGSAGVVRCSPWPSSGSARGALTLGIVALGRSTQHIPLYVAEALIVEVVAAVVGRDRQLTLGAVAGALIGTVGFASRVGLEPRVDAAAVARPTSFPRRSCYTAVAGTAGGVLGGLIGRAVAPEGVAHQPTPRFAAGLAWAGAAGGDRASACRSPSRPAGRPTSTSPPARADADTARPDRRGRRDARPSRPTPPPRNAEWFEVLAWQGSRNGSRGGLRVPGDATPGRRHLAQRGTDPGRRHLQDDAPPPRRDRGCRQCPSTCPPTPPSTLERSPRSTAPATSSGRSRSSSGRPGRTT